jgi:cardiolipin synthase A/B
MRGALFLTILLILLPIGQGVLSSTPVIGSPATIPNVKIREVLVRFPFEHVGIVNLGGSCINLTGWSLSDGEGTWSFECGPSLAAGGELFVGSNLTFLQLIHPSALKLDPNVLAKKGRLILADDGDEVLLLDQHGVVVDVLAYGKSIYSGAGWVGEKFPASPEGKAISREHIGPYSDSDTKNDWSVIALGRSSFLPISTESMVEPFLCPEHMRSRVLREITFAHGSICIEVYILSDLAIATALASAIDRGVRVRVLVEGEPVGGLTDSQRGILQALRLAGCEVYLSCAYHGFKRFDYLHPKFLMADGRRVLLASENFAPTSLEGNRGWGVTIDSPTVANALLDVFQSDVDPRFPDIRALGTESSFGMILPEDRASELDRSAPDAMKAKIETVLAPDFGYSSILELIEGARNRLYLELYYLTDRWQTEFDPYHSILNAARRGASVRLVLDGNWYNNEDGKGNTVLAERMNAVAFEEGLDLRAKILSPYHGVDTLHNKGVIADDKVLVCSINWVRASFERNREAGVIIDAPQVAGFYVEAFEKDWVDDAIAPELSLPSLVHLEEGQQLVLSANASDNSGTVRVLWDVGCDGSIQREGPFFVTNLPVGETLILVTAVDSSNNSQAQMITVVVMQKRADTTLVYAAAASLAIPLVIWRIRKRVKRS